MFKTQFTPGPWHISQVVTKGDGLRVFHLDSENQGPVGYFDSLDDPDGDDEANARLIAAAPEMLFVLQYVMDELRREHPHDWTQEHYEEIAREAKEVVLKALQPQTDSL